MAGKRHKEKGNRVERKVRDLFRSWGFSCDRVPLSGSAEGFKGDLRVDFGPVIGKQPVEVKAREKADGWKVVKGWLGDNPMLVLCEDRAEPLFVLTQGFMESLLERLYHDHREPPDSPAPLLGGEDGRGSGRGGREEVPARLLRDTDSEPEDDGFGDLDTWEDDGGAVLPGAY